MVATHLMTAEQLADRPDGEARLELIEGDLFETGPAGTSHVLVVSLLVDSLVRYRIDHPGVRILVGEGGYLLARNPDTVLSPDIALMTEAQLRSISPRSNTFTEIAPLLVIEVKSPSDHEAQIARKLGIYLTAGVREVWWVSPEEGSVTIHSQDRAPEKIAHDGVLESQELLPGFSLPLSDLFGK